MVALNQLVPTENPQLALFWRQTVPVALGKVIVCVPVAAEVRVVKKLVLPVN